MGLFRPRSISGHKPFNKLERANLVEMSLVESCLLTYPVGDSGELATHHLDVLASATRVLVVGTDMTLRLYDCESLTESVEHFATAALQRFPYIDAVIWDLVVGHCNQEWSGVSFDVCLEGKRIVELRNPVCTAIDGRLLSSLLKHCDRRIPA